MEWQWSFSFLLIICVHVSYQRSTPESKTYRAAVVEYASKYLGDSAATFRANTAAYEKYIKDAAAQDADIIVFPEDGLSSFGMPERNKLEPWTTLIPAVSEKYIPCTNDTIPVSETMKRLSCAARDNSIYVVINLMEKELCQGDNCREDGVFYYNSNAVFDRNGMIIARYRKTNLIGEMIFDVTKEPEVVTFDTDFGVKFGTFICFDIFYQDPPTILTRSVGVRDIVYPTAWFSETPFLTAPQIQAGWSYVEDVNLLASGYHNLKGSNGGSGIYLGKKGIAKAIMPLNENYQELIISDVPKKGMRTDLEPPHKREREVPPPPSIEIIMEARKKQFSLRIQDLELMRDNHFTFWQTELLTNNSVVQKTMCQNNFCCNFTAEITKRDPNVNYRLIVADGLRSFQYVRSVGVRACGIIQCSNDTLASCGSVTDTETTFAKIKIEAQYDDYRNSWIMPATLSTSVFPLTDWNLQENAQNDSMHIEFSMNVPTKNVATFGFYSRYFARDDVNLKASSSSSSIHLLGFPLVFALRHLL